MKPDCIIELPKGKDLKQKIIKAYVKWSKSARFYLWTTTAEHAALNYEAGYKAALKQVAKDNAIT